MLGNARISYCFVFQSVRFPHDSKKGAKSVIEKKTRRYADKLWKKYLKIRQKTDSQKIKYLKMTLLSPENGGEKQKNITYEKRAV